MAICPHCNGEGLEPDDTNDECSHCDGTGTVETDSGVAFYSVGIYMVDRAYGGPEEGGWWYDCGDPVEWLPDSIEPSELVRIFAPEHKEQAYVWRDQLQAKLDTGPNVGRREISSVLSEGRYAACLMPGYPRAWPNPRPHYE